MRGSLSLRTAQLIRLPNSLRSTKGFRLNFEAALSTVDQWTRIAHPNIVAVKEAFTTRDFGDSCASFDYPCSVTHSKPIGNIYLNQL